MSTVLVVDGSTVSWLDTYMTNTTETTTESCKNCGQLRTVNPKMWQAEGFCWEGCADQFNGTGDFSTKEVSR